MVGGQASVTSGRLGGLGRGEMVHSCSDPPVLLSAGRERDRGRERERETVREGLFVRLQEQSGLEAAAGKPGPQREKKRAFNMVTGLLTSARGEE